MDVDGYTDELERLGRALADAAAAAGADAPVPTCPGWTVLDLLTHTGGVHAWAAGFVRAEPDADPDPADEDMPRPDGDPVGWYRERHADLVAALRAAPPDLATWSFLPAPTPLAFWARRQAHETAVHRADAAAALSGIEVSGIEVSGISPAFAADGVDELLLGFMARPGRLRSDAGYRLLVAPDDVPQRWLVEVGPAGATTSRGTGPADATLRGPAAPLYLFLWNRVGSVPVQGDAAVAARWREQARVTWS